MGFPDSGVDHRYGKTWDNRKIQLRLASQLENSRNKMKCKNNTSGFKGVSRDNVNNKWRAKIQVNNRTLCLGRFEGLLDAAKAYNIAAVKYFGEFARLNIIKEK